MRLVEIRKNAGLTQIGLAKMMGVDQTAIHQWETGKTAPRLKHLKRLAEVLGCTVNDLLSTQDNDGGESSGMDEN